MRHEWVYSFRFWCLNTLTADFCVEALLGTLAKFGRPETFDTAYGAMFTRDECLKALEDAGVAISMDRTGRWIENVFIKRLCRSVNNKEVYLHANTNGSTAQTVLTRHLTFNNARGCR